MVKLRPTIGTSRLAELQTIIWYNNVITPNFGKIQFAAVIDVSIFLFALLVHLQHLDRC